MKIIFLMFGAIFSPQLLAFTIDFNCITNNDNMDCETGESQFLVDVNKTDEENVLFTFLNTGLNESFIADIYFDSENTLEYLGLIDADEGVGGDFGVDFSLGAQPKNLPAAKSLDDPFVSFVGFSNDPGAANGIQTGESLGILFYLTNDMSYEDLINNINNGTFKIGIHGQGFDGGGSESFTNSVTTVPIPITFWLFGSGLLMLLGANTRNKES